MITGLYINSQTMPVKRVHDILLITGDGKRLKEDLIDFAGINQFQDVLCIGRSIKVCPFKVDHYADVDADEGYWVADNLMKNNPDKARNGHILRHTLGKARGFDIDWEVEGSPWPMADIMWHGSTALFAAMIGLAMGYQKIVLAGCPIDSKGHWYFDEDYGPRWTVETYQAWFEFAETPEADMVRSLSGYTKTLLGRPDKKWLSLKA